MERTFTYSAIGVGIDEMMAASILVNEAWHLKILVAILEKLKANQHLILRAMQYLECALEYTNLYLTYMGEDLTLLPSRYRTLLIKVEAAYLLFTLTASLNSANCEGEEGVSKRESSGEEGGGIIIISSSLRSNNNAEDQDQQKQNKTKARPTRSNFPIKLANCANTRFEAMFAF